MGPQQRCGPYELGMRGCVVGGVAVMRAPLVECGGGSDVTPQVEHGDGGSVAGGVAAMRPCGLNAPPTAALWPCRLSAATAPASPLGRCAPRPLMLIAVTIAEARPTVPRRLCRMRRRRWRSSGRERARLGDAEWVLLAQSAKRGGW